MGTNKRDHIRPVLKKLHWLPIENRIVFKILLLTFKARAKLAPQYIQDLINDYTPQRNLRSGSKSLLETPNYNLESYGKRAFSVAAPRLWNSLPMELKTSTSIDIFKKKLKTYLFKHSYFWTLNIILSRRTFLNIVTFEHWTLFFLHVYIFIEVLVLSIFLFYAHWSLLWIDALYKMYVLYYYYFRT